MIMPANNTSGIVHYYAGAKPGSVGLLYTPEGILNHCWGGIRWYFPYAIDNGAFVRFDKDQFIKALVRITKFHPPLWILVPDVVADAEATIIKWHYWHRRVAPFGRLAFAVQDGMDPVDVPPEAYCVFVGGSTKWKLQNAPRFKGVSKWLHIGRVNSPKRIEWARMIGADSIDGTGFFRGNPNRLKNAIERRQGCFQL